MLFLSPLQWKKLRKLHNQFDVTQCLRLCFPETDSEMKTPVQEVYIKEVVTERIRKCAEETRQEKGKPSKSEISGRVPRGSFNLTLPFLLVIHQRLHTWGHEFPGMSGSLDMCKTGSSCLRATICHWNQRAH